jgi:hypothetical protein
MEQRRKAGVVDINSYRIAKQFVKFFEKELEKPPTSAKELRRQMSIRQIAEQIKRNSSHE